MFINPKAVRNNADVMRSIFFDSLILWYEEMNSFYYDELINELSDLCGILPDYWDIFGRKHITSIETKKAVLRSMRVNIDSIDAIKDEN